MTLDDLDLFPEPDDRAPRKCWRHDWRNTDHDSVVNHGYEEPFASDGSYPDRWVQCRMCNAIDPPSLTCYVSCARCGKVRDEAVAKRNKRNRQRGGAFERTVAEKLGGRKTGPLGGRDDVMVGELFAIQTKRAQRFALTEARTYLADLRRTYPTRTPLVVHALPGERGGVVILDLESWVELHGKDGQP